MLVVREDSLPESRYKPGAWQGARFNLVPKRPPSRSALHANPPSLSSSPASPRLEKLARSGRSILSCAGAVFAVRSSWSGRQFAPSETRNTSISTSGPRALPYPNFSKKLKLRRVVTLILTSSSWIVAFLTLYVGSLYWKNWAELGTETEIASVTFSSSRIGLHASRELSR